MPQPSMKQCATAHHEAGHALLAWQCRIRPGVSGVRIKSVSVIPGEGYEGRVEHRGLFQRCHRPDINMTLATEARLMAGVDICLAGHLAQRMFNARTCRRWQSRSDYHSAVDLAGYINNGNVPATEAFLKWREVCVQQVLQGRWPLIEALASELLKRQRLSEGELDRWMDSYFGVKPLSLNQQS